MNKPTFYQARPTQQLSDLIRAACRLSDDPIVRKQARGWFPRLLAEVLAEFIKNKETK